MTDPVHPTPSAAESAASLGANRRRGLGRGLGALLASTQSANPASPEVLAQAEAGGVQMVAIDHISPNPEQPRTHFDETALLELAASIREHGIIQPLIVTQNPQAGAGHYWLVAGERRWRASHLAGRRDVPVILREATPQQLLEWALVENVQRADLSPLEEAAAYQEMIQRFSLTQTEVADRVGKSRSAVANTVRLLQLPVPVQEALNDGHISAGHARSLLSLPDDQAMQAALKEILAKGLNVRQTELLVKRLLDLPAPAPQADLDPRMQAHMRALEDQFRSRLGTKVNLARNADGSGRLVIHFFSDEDLDHLYTALVGGPEASL